MLHNFMNKIVLLEEVKDSTPLRLFLSSQDTDVFTSIDTTNNGSLDPRMSALTREDDEESVSTMSSESPAKSALSMSLRWFNPWLVTTIMTSPTKVKAVKSNVIDSPELICILKDMKIFADFHKKVMKRCVSSTRSVLAGLKGKASDLNHLSDAFRSWAGVEQDTLTPVFGKVSKTTYATSTALCLHYDELEKHLLGPLEENLGYAICTHAICTHAIRILAHYTHVLCKTYCLLP